jgi:hypothetical protein
MVSGTKQSKSNSMQKEWIGNDKEVFFIVAKFMDLLYLRIGNKYRLHPILLKISFYKCAPKTHSTFKCDRCATKLVINWYRCTP